MTNKKFLEEKEMCLEMNNQYVHIGTYWGDKIVLQIFVKLVSKLSWR